MQKIKKSLETHGGELNNVKVFNASELYCTHKMLTVVNFMLRALTSFLGEFTRGSILCPRFQSSETLECETMTGV